MSDPKETWDDLTEEEKLQYAGVAHVVAVATTVDREAGSEYVRGSVFWVTHMSSPDFATETTQVAGGTGQFSKDREWFIGYINPGAAIVADEGMVELALEDKFLMYLNIQDKQGHLTLSLDEMRTIGEKILKDGYKIDVGVIQLNSKGGEA